MKRHFLDIFTALTAPNDTLEISLPTEKADSLTKEVVEPREEPAEPMSHPTAPQTASSTITYSGYTLPVTETPNDTLAVEETLPTVPLQEAGAIPAEFQVGDLSFKGLETYAPDSLQTEQAVIGKKAEQVPYRPFADSGITLCIVLAFFLLAYVLTNGKRYLFQQLKNIFYMRERASLFAVETGADVRYRTILVILTNVLLAIFFFDYTHDQQPELFQKTSPLLMLGIYIGCVFGAFLLKLGLYEGVNLIFFEKAKRHQWFDSYMLIYSFLGILLFPLLLLVVFFDLAHPNSYILFLILVGFGEIMLIYKCFNIFFCKRYGALHLILYLCTLEMVPCFLLWQALITANNMLIIKN